MRGSKYPRQVVFEMARLNNWMLEQEQPDIGLWIFVRPGEQINIYSTRGTVGTSLDHPKQGKTQMFRKYVSVELLEKIFKNPRFHSGRGYQEK